MLIDEITEIAVWDTETTGVDTENDLIVTSFFGIMDAATGEMIERHEWIIDHGIEIPTGASDIHGWTTERVREHGRKDADAAILEIADAIESCAATDTPLAIYNATFDLTMLDRALRRMGRAPLAVPPVILDGYVLDKAIDQYRRGSRKLVDTAAHYRVPVAENAHDAEADCIMAGKVTLFILGHSAFKGLTLQEIHDKSVGHAKKQRESLKAYFVKSGKTEAAASVRPEWPIIPFESKRESAEEEGIMPSMTMKGVVADAQEAYEQAGEGGTVWDDLSDHQKGLIATRLGEVRSAIAELDQAKAMLEEILRTKTEGEDAEDVAGFKISTSPNRTLDSAALAADYPVADFPNIYKTVIDVTAAKKHIALVDLDDYYKTGDSRLNFKPL